jgi:creatinine amidohydrolase/Fe(II)-dependent formamide hydrolase-like protein
MNGNSGIRIFAEMSPDELSVLPRDKTVFFISVGSLADKGPHLPMGASLLSSRALSNRVGKSLIDTLPDVNIVILPDLALSVSSASSGLFLGVRAHVLRDALVDQCEALGRLGFKWFVCFSDERTPRQLTAIEDAGEFLWSRTSGWKSMMGRWAQSLPGGTGRGVTLVSACSALVDRSELWRAPLWPDPIENGGKVETSKALAGFRGLVGSMYGSLPAVERPASRWLRFKSWFQNKTRGYWGEPALATSELGEKLLGEESLVITTKLRALLSGSPGHELFRSGFRLFPTNHSLFGVWLLGGALTVILVSWVVFSVRWMVQGGP